MFYGTRLHIEHIINFVRIMRLSMTSAEILGHGFTTNVDDY